MAKAYQRGETPVFSLVTRNKAGTKTSADTSMTITVQDPDGTDVVSLQAMTEDATGEYSYNSYTLPAAAVLGGYAVECIATNSSKVSIHGGRFEVVERTT